MKKYALVFAFTILLPSFAMAAGPFKIGTEISHITYEEKNLSVGLPQAITVKEQGIMYGITASATSAEKLYLKADGKVAFGQVDYTGSGSINDIEDFMFEGRGLVGWVFRQNNLNVIPYTGFGYRYLSDDASGRQSSDGSYAYLRQANYEYLPVGLLFEKPIGKNWSGDLNLELDALLGGHQVSRLDEITVNGVSAGFPRVDNKQDTGAAIKIALNVRHKGRVDISAGPFIRWWKVQDSSDSNGFYEPKNTSLEVGGGVFLTF